jgi:hypothetical protein
MPNIHSTIELAEVITYLKREILTRDEMIEERDAQIEQLQERIKTLDPDHEHYRAD